MQRRNLVLAAAALAALAAGATRATTPRRPPYPAGSAFLPRPLRQTARRGAAPHDAGAREPARDGQPGAGEAAWALGGAGGAAHPAQRNGLGHGGDGAHVCWVGTARGASIYMASNSGGKNVPDTKVKRAWRRPESYEAEMLTRNLVKPFLESRGYLQVSDIRRKLGAGQSQIVEALDPRKMPIRFRVRSCWRWSNGREPGKVSAAQLTARYVGSFEETLDNVIRKNEKVKVTHLLLVQSDGFEIVRAASIPVPELRRIWEKQREVSIEVINAGKMGRIRKNHAENGDSPTLWLMDNREAGGKAVADALWSWPGVIDVGSLPVKLTKPDDTYDDLPEVDSAIYGSENPPKRSTTRSEVQRDPVVRRKVAARAVAGCERPSCSDNRTYSGFLDVHHILGVEKSDRVWTCVALCPNCHREAHYGPDADHLNLELLLYASRFK